MNASHLLPSCRIGRICQVDSTTLQPEAHGVRDGARCPACGVWSGAGHGSYQRQPADLPLLGKVVQIVLRLRRSCCHNVACARRTFAERLPSLLAAYARRTRRLAAAQGAVAARTPRRSIENCVPVALQERADRCIAGCRRWKRSRRACSRMPLRCVRH